MYELLTRAAFYGMLLTFHLCVFSQWSRADDEAAQAAVAVELAKLKLKSTPVSPVPIPTPIKPTGTQRITTSSGSVIELQDGVWRYVSEQSIGAPGVAPQKTFRNGEYNSDHRCPNPECRYESPPRQGTWIVRGTNSDGTHNHSCPQCGTTWRH